MSYDLTPDLQKKLLSTETILWSDRPAPLSYLITGIPVLSIGLCWGVSTVTTLLQIRQHEAPSLPAPFVFVYLLPFWLSLANTLRILLVLRRVSYALTNQRFLIQTGFWGTQFQSISLTEIESLRVASNPVEKFFDLGSIELLQRTPQANVEPERLRGIRSPAAVHRHLEKSLPRLVSPQSSDTPGSPAPKPLPQTSP
ncbi:MAG: hypothetical protein RLZZ399_2049 [Verrucomicrobiota bacterium]|jgi:membrane protein YdbS with pleckstrin-like domain